jgi:hypothetical protein
MRKKIIELFIVMLLIICSISYSVAALITNKNSHIDDEKVSTNMNEPLTIRAEITELDSRKVLLSAYATNTWDKTIQVHWDYIPCLFGVFYLVPNEDDMGLLVYYPYQREIFRFMYTEIEFGPAEEKLIQTAVFFGVSNWILQGLRHGYHNYIDSFPWLPDGDYRFDAHLNAYILTQGDRFPTFLYDNIFFHYGV